MSNQAGTAPIDCLRLAEFDCWSWCQIKVGQKILEQSTDRFLPSRLKVLAKVGTNVRKENILDKGNCRCGPFNVTQNYPRFGY